MNFHSRLVGALDAVILTLTALLMIALLYALMNPLAANDRTAGFASSSLPAVAEYATTHARRL